MRLLKTVILVAVFALALAACGGGEETSSEAPSSDGPTLTVLQNDIYYGETPDNESNPPTWTVPAGASVTVEMENAGALEHNWAIVKAGETVPNPYVDEESRDIILYDTGLVDPGSSATATFTAPEAGEYTVICTVAAHYPSMQGRLIVTDS